MQTKKLIKSGVVSLIAAVLITGVFVLIRRSDYAGIAALILDGVAVSSVVLIAVGFLGYVYGLGYFSWISYLLFMARYLLGGKREIKFLNFSDYTATLNNHRNTMWVGCCVGALLLLVSVFLVL